jgi:hypothetical protein
VKTTILALALALIASPIAQAGQGPLTFGGQHLCSEITHATGQEEAVWMSWVLGNWSAMNAAAGSEGVVGQKLAKADGSGRRLYGYVVNTCLLDDNRPLQSMVEIVYNRIKKSGE